MNELLNILLGCLPREPRSYGDMILCPSETSCGIIADFLQDILRESTITVTTGYFDPFEDRRNNECDDYTGFYYIEFA